MCLTEYDAEKHMQDIAKEFKAVIDKMKEEISAKDAALQKQQDENTELKAELERVKALLKEMQK